MGERGYVREKARALVVEITYIGISPLIHTPHEAEVLGVSRWGVLCIDVMYDAF